MKNCPENFSENCPSKKELDKLQICNVCMKSTRECTCEEAFELIPCAYCAVPSYSIYNKGRKCNCESGNFWAECPENSPYCG